MDTLLTILDSFNNFLYTYLLLFLLLGCGLYFSIRTRFVQVRLLLESLRILMEKKRNASGVSSFQALMISTASRVGTGNIAGVATAISLGGAGSIFWMWVSALIGSASAFIESTLAQVYKESDRGEFRGGPAYYIQGALHKRWLGILFSILLILCFVFGFNALQSYNVSSAFAYYIDNYEYTSIPALIGLILALLTAFVIFGGIHRIGFITSVLVPVMAILYILLGLYITFCNLEQLPGIFARIFAEAFDFSAISGGLAGSGILYGIKRGLFSNEAGMGSAPNAAATADVSHPAKQGLVQMLSVFIDTFFICTTTAMILLNYHAANPDLTGMPYVQQAVNAQIGEIGIHFITISIFLFAFSSLIGNYCYAESNLKFIKDNPKLLFCFRILVLLVIFQGAQSGFETVWNLADILMGLMAIVNIIAILLLGNTAIKVLQDYLRQKKNGDNPVLHAETLDIPRTKYWN